MIELSCVSNPHYNWKDLRQQRQVVISLRNQVKNSALEKKPFVQTAIKQQERINNNNNKMFCEIWSFLNEISSSLHNSMIYCRLFFN